MKKSVIRTGNRVALYARFSSDNQRSESIDAQIRAMTAYCQHHHYIIVDTYIDEAKSATTDRRPDFQRMIEDSKKGIFDIVLVHKLDRFARNRYDSAVYKRELKKNGVSVYSVLENLDNSPESIMMESVLEGMAEYYSQNLGREVMKGMKETALQCKHTGGKPPLGYDIDKETKRLVVNKEEAKAVQLIFEMYANGEGYTAILRRLFEERYHTKQGKDFQKNSLYSILTNPKYQGQYVFNRSSAKAAYGTRNTHLLKPANELIVVDGGCPAIIDPSTFEAVQKRIVQNKHAGKRHTTRETYLLSGKVYCKECGRAMVGNKRYSGGSKQLYITYRCPSKNYCCCNKEINKAYLEQYVETLLENQIFSLTSLHTLERKVREYTQHSNDEPSLRLEQIEMQLAQVNLALQRVADAVADGLLSPVLVERLSALENEQANLEREKDALLCPASQALVMPDIRALLEQYKLLSQAPAAPQYREFLQSFIGEIKVGRYTLSITLKTGLGVCDSLDTTLFVRRQEVYQQRIPS